LSRHCLRDAFHTVLGFLADYIYRVAVGEVSHEIKIPEPELVARVARRDVLHEMLDLGIDPDDDPDLIRLKA
jgi:hypothetical protein